jgi:hypothetical protein
MTCPICGNPTSVDCISHTTDRITAVLDEVYEPEGVRIWLHSHQPRFGLQRAVDLIAAGRGDEVLLAAQSLL